MDQTVRADLPEMKAKFPPTSLQIIHTTHVADEINNGHTIQINYTDGGAAVEDVKVLQLEQVKKASSS